MGERTAGGITACFFQKQQIRQRQRARPQKQSVLSTVHCSHPQEDIRFKDYPVVTGWPYVRFYAAAPLVNSGGQRLGTL